jgi:hypothetical protein
MARIGENQQSTASRLAGARRLPLRLRDQPRRRHSTTVLVWTIFDSDVERRDETPAFLGGCRIKLSHRKLVVIHHQIPTHDRSRRPNFGDRATYMSAESPKFARGASAGCVCLKQRRLFMRQPPGRAEVRPGGCLL